MRAAWIVGRDATLLRGGGLELGARGRILRVLESEADLQHASRAPTCSVHDFGQRLLAPGFVDAHAHLELSALRRRVPAGASFADWIASLLGVRARTTNDELAAAARRGADELLASGTTLVADVDSLGLCGGALVGHPLRRIAFHELLDARDPQRTSAALERARNALGVRSEHGHGLSPHAPTTNSAELLSAAARLARSRRARLMIHWAETPEEERWLEQGDGPLAALLAHSPRARGLALLEDARLLGPRTLLVHGNQARADERRRVAAAGASLVHCPGTHSFFARPRFPWEDWSVAGVRLALGTDSLASNDALDLRRELALLCSTHPQLDRREAWLAATREGARALGLGGRVGELVPGASADFLVLDAAPTHASAAWELLTQPSVPVHEVWIRGRPACSRSGTAGNELRVLDFRGAPPQ